jgi:hypothetical protein
LWASKPASEPGLQGQPEIGETGGFDHVLGPDPVNPDIEPGEPHVGRPDQVLLDCRHRAVVDPGKPHRAGAVALPVCRLEVDGKRPHSASPAETALTAERLTAD